MRRAFEQQQLLYLRPEREILLALCVVKRLYAKAIPRAEELLRLFIVDAEPPHAVEMVHAVLAPAVIGGEQHLRVGVRRKRVAKGNKLRAKLNVVVNLAIVGNRIAIQIAHGLERNVAQIQNGQPSVPKAKLAKEHASAAVRPAMRNRIHHRPNFAFRNVSRQTNDSADSAHAVSLQRCHTRPNTE